MPIDEVYDAAIVSAYGRGYRLAESLMSRGLKVVIIEITQQLAPFVEEQGQAPFGEFVTPQAESSDAAGLPIWLKTGPIHLRGPLAHFYIKKFNEIKWLQLIYQGVFSTEFAHVDQLEDTGTMPFHKDFYSAKNSASDRKSQLKELEAKGVTVLYSASILDLSLLGARLEAIEVSAPDVGTWALKFKQLVWTLTSHQTQTLNESLCSKLYPWGTLTPMWYWSKCEIRLEGDGTAFVPPLCLIIENKNEVLSHQNLIFFQRRTADTSRADLWIKVPHAQRASRHALQMLFRKSAESIESRIYQSKVSVETMPVEYRREIQECGEALFPVYSVEEKDSFRGLKSPQLQFLSPEVFHYYEEDHIKQFEHNITEKMNLYHQKVLKELAKKQRGGSRDSEV